MFGLPRRKKPAEAPKKPERYRQLDRLGEGGMAVVSSTFDNSLQRLIATKELKARNVDQELSSTAFVREARIVCFLDHPGIVPIYDSYERHPGHLCYAMKLIEGETLGKRMGYIPSERRATPLPVVETLRIFVKIAEALCYAHDRGVVHLDLKPDNIMLGRYGEVFVMDWGNARLYDPGPYRDYLARHGGDLDLGPIFDDPPDIVSGTPLYMSPEQTRSPRNLLGPTSDVFSAGILLYLMLTGRLPFRGPNVDAVLQGIRETIPPPVHELNPAVPLRLSQICAQMLIKTPEDRYQDFRTLLDEFSALLDSGQAFAERRFEAGEVIFEEGDAGECTYTIVDGLVEISKRSEGGERVIASLARGEILGELAIITGEPRTATARALEPTTLRMMGREDVESELQKLAPWVGSIVKALALRFKGLNERLLDGDPE